MDDDPKSAREALIKVAEAREELAGLIKMDALKFLYTLDQALEYILKEKP